MGVDEATHLILAESLSMGRYNDEFLLGAPRHAQYPPLMSVWLLALRTFSSSLEFARAATLVLLAVTALLVGDSVRRVSSPWIGLSALTLVALNPALLTLAGTLRSETLFMTFTAAALWATVSIPDSCARVRSGAAFALATAAFFTRSAGVAVLGAVLYPVVRRNLRQALYVLAAAAAVAAAWFAYTSATAAGSMGRSYATDISLIFSDQRGMLVHIAVVGRAQLSTAAPIQFGVPNVPGTGVDTALYAAIILFATVVGSGRLFRQWPAAGAHLVLGTAMVLVWPWAHARFVSPLLPWIIAAMLLGVMTVAQWLRVRRPELASVGLAGLLAVVGVVHQAGVASTRVGCRADASAYTNPQCSNSESRSFAPAALYVRDSLPADAVVATQKPALVNLLSGRTTIPFGKLVVNGELELLRPGSPVTHAIVTRHTLLEREAYAVALEHACAELQVVARFPLGSMIIAPRGAEGTADACPDLRRHRVGSAKTIG